MKVVVYEDNLDDFYPLVNFFPQCYLRIGLGTIIDNFQHFFPKFRFEFLSRELFKFKFDLGPGPVMFLSSRLLLKDKIPLPKEEVKFTINGDVIGFLKVNQPFPRTIAEIAQTLKNLKKSKEIEGYALANMCDLVRFSEPKLQWDFARHSSGLMKVSNKQILKKIEIIGKKHLLYVHRNAIVHGLVAIDVTEGPVLIDRGAVIRPFTTIVGPSYIGEGTIVDRAKIVKSTIGPYCRIGGEIEACIFQGYANKCHEGFLGHSFVGEWVNLGALTTNSDLKNNYSKVKIKSGERIINSGMLKLGCFIGDHAKLGIGSFIPTGAVIGSFVNFFSGGTTPRYISSFKWLGSGIDEKYSLEKAIETARVVMERRGVKLTTEYENLIKVNYKHLENKP